MRDIKFSGKRKDNGKWIEGYYCFTTKFAGRDERIPVIITESDLCNHCLWADSGTANSDNPVEAYEVDPSTVGQYTGCNDRRGNEICEGDIVRVKSGLCAVVEFSNFSFNLKWSNGHIYPFGQECEIIGNIHDNPNLLESEGK